MILIATLALAADPAVVIFPASGGPDEATVARTLTAADLEESRAVDVARFVRGVAHVALTDTLGPDCAAPLPLTTWRKQLTAARRKFDLLDPEGSLSALVDLDLGLECLAEPPVAADLYDLDIARADAHLLLAGAATDDPAQAAFHAQEAAAALDHAASLGVEPGERVSPDLLPPLAAAAARWEASRPARVAAVGLGVGDQVWVDGWPLDGAMIGVAAGTPLVERVVDGVVVAARRVQLREGEGCVLDLGGDTRPLDDVVNGLVRAAPGRETAALLAALAAVRAEPDERVVYLGWTSGAALWAVADGGVERLPVPRTAVTLPAKPVERAPDRDPGDEPTDEPDARPTPTSGRKPSRVADHEDEPVVRSRRSAGWSATAALWFGAGVRSDDGAGLLATGLLGRVAVSSTWAVAWAILPQTAASDLDPSGDGVRIALPITLGARWGSHGPGWTPEVGADLGVRWEPDAELPWRPQLAACGALGRGTGPGGGVRLQLCVDTTFADVSATAGVGFESRI